MAETLISGNVGTSTVEKKDNLGRELNLLHVGGASETLISGDIGVAVRRYKTIWDLLSKSEYEEISDFFPKPVNFNTHLWEYGGKYDTILDFSPKPVKLDTHLWEYTLHNGYLTSRMPGRPGN